MKDAFTARIARLNCSDRWSISQRLQELKIPYWSLADGSLEVHIDNPLVAVQVRSIVMQFTASRSELLAWLEFCWHQ